MQPVTGPAPAAGTQVGLYINDAGRLALSQLMGPEISRIEGKLLDSSNGEYLLAVSTVQTFRAGEQTWAGEKVRIKSEYVVSTQERRFSPGRTIAFGAVGAGGMALFVTQFASGLFFPDPEVPVPGDTSSTQRVPRSPRPW